MKHIFFFSFIQIISSNILFAQKLIFTGKIEFDIQNISNQLVQKTSSCTLFFNDSIQRNNFVTDYSKQISSFKNSISNNREIDSLEVEREVQDLIYELNQYTIYNYRYLNENKSFSKQYKDEFYYVIDSVTKQYNFDFKNEFDTILGFKCQKVTSIGSNNKTVEIWFAEEIKFSVGPYNWTGLPGAILKMQWNNGNSRIIASKIEIPLNMSIVDDLSKHNFIDEVSFGQIQLKPIKEVLKNDK